MQARKAVSEDYGRARTRDDSASRLAAIGGSNAADLRRPFSAVAAVLDYRGGRGLSSMDLEPGRSRHRYPRRRAREPARLAAVDGRGAPCLVLRRGHGSSETVPCRAKSDADPLR